MPREWYSPRRVGDRQMCRGATYAPAFNGRFQNGLVSVHISRVFPHVEAMMVIMQTVLFHPLPPGS